jgi:phospholipid/cholesterol/gamma-HCH transport system ATP-binding protein
MTTSSSLTSDNIIEIDKLWTVFGEFVIHKNLDLQIRRGEIMSIVGGSGTGKTTLLRQMIGLEKPSRGTVRVFGQAIAGLDAVALEHVRARWAMLFQQGALFSALSLYDNVALPLRERGGIPESLIRDMVYLKLRMVGLAAKDAVKMPSDLSGGMIKRAALARALALEPELLFLDEPTAGLDPESCESFVALLRALHRELGLTVVIVTHDLDTLFELTTRVAVLADQRVIVVAPVKEVLTYPHAFVKEFFLGERGQRAMEVLREYPFIV